MVVVVPRQPAAPRSKRASLSLRVIAGKATTPMDDSQIEAEALYRSLMASDADSPLPRFSLARLCFDSGRPAEAVELLRFCVGKTADWAAAWLLLGDALVAAGSPAEAKTAY